MSPNVLCIMIMIIQKYILGHEMQGQAILDIAVYKKDLSSAFDPKELLQCIGKGLKLNMKHSDLVT